MRLLTMTILLTGLLAISTPGYATENHSGWPLQFGAVQEPELPDLDTYQGCMSLSQAVERVRRQTGGRIVSADTRTSGGRTVHIIKVLSQDGKVSTHRIPGC